MEQRTKNKERRTVTGLSAAFSLVEVTLALMVMAIGVLSVMSLFPAGLDQNVRAMGDTHAAFFAEEVFAGLRARSETNWNNLDQFSVPVAASNNWNELDLVEFGEYVEVKTNKYVYPGTDYEDHALRYSLVLRTNGLIKEATLFVWPDEFGTLNDPKVFYAELFRTAP